MRWRQRIQTIGLLGELGVIGASCTAVPIVILATGQSNMTLHPALAWVPEANVFLWNHDGEVHPAGHVGTAFAAMDATTMQTCYSFANEVAKANPDRQVYLVNASESSLPIAKWLPGGVPDLYACCKNNIEASLAFIGATKIDYLLWWQGETDAHSSSQTYLSDFNTVHARFRSEEWFPYVTPVVIFGISRLTAAIQKPFNNILRQIVLGDASHRVFVDTATLPASYWDAPGNIHLNAAGYELAGIMGYNQVTTGSRSGKTATPWHTVPRVEPGSRANTAVLADDEELRFGVQIGHTYKVRGRMHGQINSAGNFKWGFAGPSFALSYGTFRVIKQEVPNVEAIALHNSPAFITDQTISGTGYFELDISMYLFNALADGLVRFQWAQAASNPTQTWLFSGSHLEVLHVAY